MNFYFTYESCDTLKSCTLFLLVDLETDLEYSVKLEIST